MKLLIITDKRNHFVEEHSQNSLTYEFLTELFPNLESGDTDSASDSRWELSIVEEEEQIYSTKEDPSDAYKRMREL